MIVALRESLHAIVNDIVASIKMINPDQAVKKSDFLVKHIFDGLFIEYIGKDENGILNLYWQILENSSRNFSEIFIFRFAT